MRNCYHKAKHAFLVLFVLLFSTNIIAQTDFTVGTGTATNTTTSYPCALQDYWEGSRAQYLFRASELTAAGMTPGFISAVKFNVLTPNTGTNPALEQFTIKIGTTTATALTNTAFETGTSIVYGPFDYTVTAGINTFSFTNNFFWNGTSNIILEVCNGDPNNANATTWTANPIMNFSTLSYNASHTRANDNSGNHCNDGMSADDRAQQSSRPNTIFTLIPAAACSGTPNAGSTASTSVNIICVGTPFTLSLTGATVATGLTYQWQSSPDNTNWNNIAGATGMTHTLSQTQNLMYYRCIVTCTAGGANSTSTPIQVNSSTGPAYVALPYTENFEQAWSNGCSTRDVPNQYWRNTPATGNNSWRRNDDGVPGAAWTSNNGAYTPAASSGNFSARFHTANTPAGTAGSLDLFIDANSTVALKRLTFDFINTSGSDSLSILLSTDGGTTFTRIDSCGSATAWRNKQIFFNSTSANTVIRFRGVSDFGSTDIGIDNIIVSNWADCSGTPTVGTVNATPTNVCANQTITLTSTGFGAGNGITYQWQVSTNGGTTWTNIPGATALSATTTQVATSLYRLQATCTLAGGSSSESAPVTVTSPLLPGGTYTINKNAPNSWPGPPGSNFVSFAAAYAALGCGVSDAVVFDVVPGSGPYNEQLIINGVVAGSSALRNITFKGNGNTLTFASTAANEKAVVKLKNTKHFIFDSLVINNTGTTQGFGVHFTNNADSNIIRKCLINVNTTSASTDFAGVVISGTDASAIGTGTTLCDFNRIEENIITGGHYGITQTATFAGGANGFNVFSGNTIRDFHSFGIYVAASYNTTIEKNNISRPTRTNLADFNGIFFTGQSNTAIVDKNRIHNPFGGAVTSALAFNGINLSNASASQGNDYLITNNLIAAGNGNGVQNGIINTGTNNVNYIHNTISLDNTTSTSTATTRGFVFSGTAPAQLFYNNIVSITRGGSGQKHCIHWGGLINSDYNNYYITPASTNFIGFFTSNRNTLAAWRTATNTDLASFDLLPIFQNTASLDYSPGNAAIDNRGFVIGIPDDINSNPRSATAPDLGAFEFVAPNCVAPPVTGNTIISPLTLCQNAPLSLNLSLTAWGSAQTFQWQYSPDLAGTYTNIGAPSARPDTTILATATGYFRCAVTCSGLTEFSTPILVNVQLALPAGSYTINNAGAAPPTPIVPGSNFQSYNQTKQAMATCGILGPIVFNVVPASGPYNEQLVLDSIRGTSIVNTITYNGNGTTIAFSSNLSNERAVIKLNAADYITFDSLVIDARGTGAFGYGFQLINNADTNTIRKSTLLINETSTSGNYAGIVVNSAANNTATLGNTRCDGNTIDRNIISGGFYGITLVGSATITEYIADNRIINNEIRDFFNSGIYIAGTNRTLIEKNLIHRPTRTIVSTGTGIQFTAAPSFLTVVSKNRITNLYGGATTNTNPAYGIWHNNVSATAGNENTVVNNLIYSLEANGIVYGIHNISGGGVIYRHNTISIDNANSVTGSASAGFYQTGSASGIEFRNNIVNITRAGNGPKHAIFLATTASDVNSNFNNFFISAPGSNNHIGSWGAVNQTTLAAWRTASNKDASSVNTAPIFENPTTGNYKPQSLAFDNAGTNLNVTTDIVDATRNLFTPDMGAYEFEAAACPSPIVAGTAVANPSTGLCLEQPIRLSLTGNSAPGSLLFQWQHSLDGVSGWTNIGANSFNPIFDTLTTIRAYYRCIVTCGVPGGGSIQNISSVVQVTLNPILPAGTYTIDGTQPTTWPPGNNFQTWQEVVAALQCGIQGSVVFRVKPGTYNEQVRLGRIRGTSPTSTVTFLADNGNPASAILSFAATSAANNYTLRLDSTRFVYFRDLTISATGTGFGRAVEFTGLPAFDSLTNCIINAPSVLNTSNNFAAVYANQFRGSDIVIKGNTINNGSSGIFITGTTVTNPANGILIDSNTVSGAYFYGIYTNFTRNVPIQRNVVNMGTPSFSTSYGIYALEADTLFRVNNNKVNIANTTGTVYGIALLNCDGSIINRGQLMNNDVIATTGNVSNMYGIHISNSPFINVYNNTVALNTSGNSSWGIFNNNSSNGNYYNNSVNSTATSASNNFAAYFLNTTATGVNIRNNIFSHKAGGRAMYIANASTISSDYNMLFTTGTILIQLANPATNYNNITTWYNQSFNDRFSIVFNPAFVSNTDLKPDLNSGDVWAIHGRGVQIEDNNLDHDGNSRPTTLIAGVPDLGAYEFYPNVQPTALSAIPANPAPNTQQVFYFGSDTVMRIGWKATVPPSIELRRYSGVVPTGLAAVPLDSMYFYIQASVPAGGNYTYDAQLHYVDSWLGSIPRPHQLGLGRTTNSNAWVVGYNSRNDLNRRMIFQQNVSNSNLGRFTGLINPTVPAVVPDQDSSNMGKRFYFAYALNQLNGGATQEMVAYFGAGSQPASVQIRVNGTTWARNYFVPANTVVASEYLPKTGADNAYLGNTNTVSPRSIEIISDVPIYAYAHAIGSASSGASMLLPVTTWGYEYSALGITGSGGFTDARHFVYMIADNDNTVVEVTPTVAVSNAGMAPNTTTTVTLNKGELLQVISTGSTTDITGTTIKSVPNSLGKCFPVAVFSGHSRTTLTINGCTSGGDFAMQQNFPATAWGRVYLLAPTSFSTTTSAPYATNVFRIGVQDPTTVVRRNNAPIGVPYNATGKYYEITTNVAEIITADKPIVVAQFTGGGTCVGGTGVGDPEMFYVSPVEQGIKNVAFYRNTEQSITVNNLTMIVPTAGLPSLRIFDGPAQQTYESYPHPQNGNPELKGVQYSVVLKQWPSSKSQVRVICDSAFTGITYGQGSVESYGYNMGTLVKNLRGTAFIRNDSLVGADTSDYTCANAPFKFTYALPVKATSLIWRFSQVPNLTPNTDVSQTNPVPSDSVLISGDKYYLYKLPQSYVFSAPGYYSVPISFTAPLIGSCDNSQTDTIRVQVIPSPALGFTINFNGCAGGNATFVADPFSTPGDITASQWLWTYNTTATSTGSTGSFAYPTAGTYPVNLAVITADGCLGDSTRNVLVNPLPVVTITNDSIATCIGENATFNISSPDPGATYNWYDAATGGTLIHTGTTYTISSVTNNVELFVEAIASTGCISAVRKRIKVEILPNLTQPTVTVTAQAANSVTFSWTAVPNAATYEVSTDNGVTWVTPSTGATGLSHTVTGLNTLQQTTILVRARGVIACQTSTSTATSGCANSTAVVSPTTIATCVGQSVTFNVSSPEAGITYTWYDAATAGNLLATGNSYTNTGISGATSIYVQQASSTCTSLTRTEVTVTILPALASPVVSVTGQTANSVTFSWSAVANAAGYQVSTNNGTTWITPSSGATGLTHTVTGLGTLQQTTILVRAVGTNNCQTGTSTAVSGCSNSTTVITPDVVSTCVGSSITIAVNTPEPGITYTWFNAATGGTLLGTGTSYSFTPTTLGNTIVYVQQASATCTSLTRKAVTITALPILAKPTVRWVQSATTPTSLTFEWDAVAGATSYQVSIDNGVNWITPSSGSTGLTHTVTGLTANTTINILVRALGTLPCQTNTSDAVTGRTQIDQIYVPNAFNPNSSIPANRVLRVYGYVIQSMQFMVFNQWGEKVFETNNQTTGWDGNYKGKPQPSGVYIYVLKMTLQNGTQSEMKGSINLIR